MEIVVGAVLWPMVVYNAAQEDQPKPSVWQWIGVGLFFASGTTFAGRI
jgi:hypothetical protein